MSTDQARLAAVLLSEHPLYGDQRFRPASEDWDDLGCVEVLPGRVYRFPQFDISVPDEDVTLSVYLGLGDLGGKLWEQEARVLTRVGSMTHPGLPDFCGSGQVAAGVVHDGVELESGLGFIRSRSIGRAGDIGPGFESDGGRSLATTMRASRDEALRQFWLLADALSVLHDARMFHRNLWPGTLEVGTAQDGSMRIALSRFEMSQMVTNLMNRRSGIADAQSLRRLYRDQHPRSALYAAPELLAFIEGGAGEGMETPSWQADVFALGIMATEWLLGEPVPEPEAYDAASVRAWQAGLRRAASSGVPRSIRTLLKAMTEPEPRDRQEAARVASALEASFETMRAELLGSHDQAPHVVGYLKAYSDVTLLDWGYITDSAESPEGRAQLEALIERDMRGAQVVLSPTGAAGFVASGSSSQAEMETAKTVIFGREIVWFCAVLTRHTPGGTEQVPFARMIRWVLQRHQAELIPRLRELREQGVRRSLFAVRAIEGRTTSDRVYRRLAQTSPSWDELERGQDRTRAISPLAESYLNALKWYLDYQYAQYDARTYAVTVASSAAGTAELRRDADRERKRRHSSTALTSKFLSAVELRLSMSDHFAEAAAEAGGAVEIDVFEDDGGKIGLRRRACRFVQSRGLEAIEVSFAAGGAPPTTCWIRLRADGALRHSIEKQAAAVSDLALRRSLVQQLVNPTAGRSLADRWSHAGGGLLGEGREAVKEILTHESLFALQGPPGTGKTEVTSQALADYLQLNPGARVLVSAQSHDALDNLAVRVLSKLGALDVAGTPALTDWVALRAASDATKGRVAEQLKPFDLTEFAGRLVANARATAREWLTTRRIEDRVLSAIIERWLAAADDSILELESRARRGANLVFATTGASTRDRLVDEYGAAEPFDWVLIEEAAKAWPTELALPLVHGLRWTLVGDQAQIGAFNRQQVERFLLGCANDPDPEIADWYERRADLLRAFDTFGNLFEVEGRRPRMELTEQYRMHSQISEVVSRSFYSGREGGGLRTMRPDEAHGVTSPGWLEGQPLVWVDTGHEQRAEPYWSNEYEAEIVSRLVRSFEPVVGGENGPSLAILTPYRKQVEVLQGRLSEYAARVHTIDSFQGREADIVVASLVRDLDPPHDRPHASVGHLAEAQRANVMLSRARRLMIVVGRMPVYARTGSAHWDVVVNEFAERGLVVPAGEVLR